MNSHLEKLDQETNSLIEKLQTNFIITWAHEGFHMYLLSTIGLINADIHLYVENNNEYLEKTESNLIVDKVLAILNDAKNLLLLKEINNDVNSFLNNFLILVHNWNSINKNNEDINTNIEAILRIFEIQNTLAGLLMKANYMMKVLEEVSNKVKDNGLTFKTSSTYLQAIKESFNKQPKNIDEIKSTITESNKQENCAI